MESTTIHGITDWLEAQKGNTIMIHKREMAIGSQQTSDIDKIELQLKQVELKSNEQSDIDHYVSNLELALHGQGEIHSAQGKVELPQNVYEISLDGKVTAHSLNNGFKIESERAEYSIEIQ